MNFSCFLPEKIPTILKVCSLAGVSPIWKLDKVKESPTFSLFFLANSSWIKIWPRALSDKCLPCTSWKLPLRKSRCWFVFWVKTAPSACLASCPRSSRSTDCCPVTASLPRIRTGLSYWGTMAPTPASCCTFSASFRAKGLSPCLLVRAKLVPADCLICSSSLPPTCISEKQKYKQERIKRRIRKRTRFLVLFREI